MSLNCAALKAYLRGVDRLYGLPFKMFGPWGDILTRKKEADSALVCSYIPKYYPAMVQMTRNM